MSMFLAVVHRVRHTSPKFLITVKQLSSRSYNVEVLFSTFAAAAYRANVLRRQTGVTLSHGVCLCVGPLSFLHVSTIDCVPH